MANVAVLTGYGINCDREMAFAFAQAGGQAERVHVADFIHGERKLADYDVLAVPGGFVFGDDLGSGRVLAVKLRGHLGRQLLDFIADGKLIIGICNGFQVLVNLGLLPGLGKPFETQAALTFNTSGRFEDRWVELLVNQQSPCVFTKGLKRLYLPVRHGEGRFVVGDDTMLKKLQQGNQIVAQYADETGETMKYPENPNGSQQAIAGICDTSGRVFGLMPHPEAAVDRTNHPRWTRESVDPVSRQIFENAVTYVKKRRKP